MTKEQAIEALKEHKRQIDKKYINTRNSKAIETVLNLIEKQKAEIERLKNIISNTSVQFINDTIKTDKKNKEDIESLNAEWKIELEKKDKEISKLKNNNKDLLRKLRNRVKEVTKLEKYSLYKKEFSRLNKQLQNKDKIIDLMAIVIGNEPLPTEEYCIFRNFDCPVVGGNRDCKDCIKQYFENKAKE